MDEAEIRELARRMGGGHPMSEVRGKADAITHAKTSLTPYQLKAISIAEAKAKAQTEGK